MKLLAILLVCVAPLSLRAETAGLKVLSLNFNAETDNHELQARRVVRFEQYVRAQNIDIIVVPESWQFEKFSNIVSKFALDLDMDVFYHMEDGVSGIRVTSLSILAKKSLHLSEGQAFVLPKSAPSIGDGKKSWVSLGQDNILLGAHLMLPGGKPAYIWAAHLNSDSSAFRMRQMKFAQEKMQEKIKRDGAIWDQSTIIFAGDLNATPESNEMRYLMENLHFKDLWQELRPKEAGFTFSADPSSLDYNPLTHGAGYIPSQLDLGDSGRIDYILYSSPQLFGANIERSFLTPEDHVWMSDHFGVLGSFSFDSRQAPTLIPEQISNAPTSILEVTDQNLSQLSSQLQVLVETTRGFTLINHTHSRSIHIHFAKDPQVYPCSHADLAPQQLVSFAFFSSGHYPFQIKVRPKGRDPGLSFDGELDVKSP